MFILSGIILSGIFGFVWEKDTPEHLDMDQNKLEEARDYALTGGGSGCIIRGGKMVMAWGDQQQKYDLYSTTKSIGGIALSLAMMDGKVCLDDRMIDIEVKERMASPMEIFSNSGMEEIGIHIQEIIPGFLGGKTKKRKVKIEEARDYLLDDEQQRLIDMDQVSQLAVERVEHSGIIFLDEVDKVAGREVGHGPEVSREGVQRDLLPIIEGTTVNTRYGLVRTDHILFIGAGAFHVTSPSDLIPELQGRFPIRVELTSLNKKDFIKILTEPENALITQYKALLETEGLQIEFTEDSIDEIADIAEKVNEPKICEKAARRHY